MSRFEEIIKIWKVDNTFKKKIFFFCIFKNKKCYWLSEVLHKRSWSGLSKYGSSCGFSLLRCT